MRIPKHLAVKGDVTRSATGGIVVSREPCWVCRELGQRKCLSPEIRITFERHVRVPLSTEPTEAQP